MFPWQLQNRSTGSHFETLEIANSYSFEVYV